MQTGWERNKRVHFDNIVAQYDVIRWDYPDALYDDIVHFTTTGKTAVEIGAGTGKATAPFLRHGFDVTAVELGENMCMFLDHKFNGNDNLHIIHNTFEDAVLPEKQYDLVYAASSFHWVDAAVGVPKAFHLLKPGGVFALFRNNFNPPKDDIMYDRIQAVYDQYYYTYYKNASRPKIVPAQTLWEPEQLIISFRFDGMEHYGFTDITMHLYESKQSYNADDYIKLMDTMSDHISLPDEYKNPLYEGIRKVIIDNNNHYTVNRTFQLYMGRKP